MMKLPSPHNPIRTLIIFLIIINTSFAWRFFPKRQPAPCPAWLHWLIALDNPLAQTHQARNIIKNAAIAPGMTILDMGCGPGRITIPAAIQVGQSATVTAVDLQEGMIKQAQKKSRAYGLNNINFFKTHLHEYTPPENYFDRILLVSVMGEIPESERVLILEKAHHGLKKNGKLSITETVFDPDYLAEKDVCSLAKQARFEAEEKFGNWISFTMNFKKSEATASTPIDNELKTYIKS